MSDSTDDMEGDYIYDEQETIDEYSKNGLWIKRDGKAIPFNQISDSYRKNIIKWCEDSGLTPPLDLIIDERIKNYLEKMGLINERN